MVQAKQLDQLLIFSKWSHETGNEMEKHFESEIFVL